MRLGARTSAGKVTTTALATFSRPGVVSTLAEVGLVLGETKTLLARLQAGMLCSQVAAYAAHHRACAACRVLQPLKDRRTRRLQTLFGTVEVEAPRFKVLPLLSDDVPSGSDGLAGRRTADRPLHTGRQAGHGRPVHPGAGPPSSRSTMLGSTWNDCGIYSGMATMRRRARL